MKSPLLIASTFIFLFTACSKTDPQERKLVKNMQAMEITALEVHPDSIAPPITIKIDTNEVWVHNTPKSNVVKGPQNKYTFGPSRIVPATEIKVYVPGQDTVPQPTLHQAHGKVVPATAPRLKPFKGWQTEDRNPGNFHYTNIKDGVAFSTLLDMAVDDRGYSWFASQGGGITRFDGSHFANFTIENGLPFEIVTCVNQDRAGHIWIGTNGGGAARYDGQTFTIFGEAEGLHNQITDFLETADGQFWIGTYGGGLFRYESDETGTGGTFAQYTEAQGICNMTPGSLLEDPYGNIWFKTHCNTIFKLEPARDGKPERITEFGPKQNSFNGDLTSMTCDGEGNIWGGSMDGILFRFDGINFIHYSLPETMASATINSLMYNNFTNQIHVSLGDIGIFSTDAGSPGKFQLITQNDGLPGHDIFDFYVDKNQRFYAVSKKALAVKRQIGFNKTYSSSDGFSDFQTNGIVEDDKGDMWIATHGGGLLRFDGDSFAYHGPEMGFHSIPMEIIRDRLNQLWIASNGGGLHKFIPDSAGGTGTFHYYMENAGLSLKWMTCVMEDSKGNIWGGTNGGGINILTPDKSSVGGSLTKIDTEQGLSSKQIYTIMEDRSGDIWMGMHAGGITRHRPGDKPGEGQWWHYGTDQGLANSNAISLSEDHLGNIWIGSPGALQLLIRNEPGKSEQLITFNEKNSPIGRVVNAILNDTDKAMWFNTDVGLLRLNAKKYDALLQKINSGEFFDDDIIFDIYNKYDGVIGAGGRNAITQDSKGRIWLSNSSFLNEFDPGQLSVDSTPPIAVISSLGLSNDQINWREIKNEKKSDITLSNGIKLHDLSFDGYSDGYGLPLKLNLAHDNNNITFGFSALSNHQPDLIKYRYILDGLDKSWSGIIKIQEVPYGNLPHGNYTFRVKAINSLGTWSEEATYPFTVRPPWWLSTLAYLAYALLFLAIIYFGHKTLKARTIRLEREKTQARELEQAKEIERAYSELNDTHEHLKSTQAQLIQSEKMASLGELTAGIAHEIQNPLNFVNNFSEVSAELIDEVLADVAAVKTRFTASPRSTESPGVTMSAVITASAEDRDKLTDAEATLTDIKQNLEKITHHGKRADAIVKGMLAHSRKSSGEKVPTDINQLTDEYLRLSYQGLRAKDKNFNAEIKTDFDPTLPHIPVIPQDMGRVFLNIINNAFYAASAVIITTKNLGDKIEISISDNGPGIPDEIKDKIFQPFFTTKPTGQGTGLGLSLSYDIVKAHGGELKVESQEGEGSKFVIRLPLI